MVLSVVVRVRVKLFFDKEELATVAVANAGFETDVAEILLPFPLTIKLGLSEELGRARKESYRAVGRYVEMLKLSNPGKVCVVTEDKSSPMVECFPIVSETEDEVTMSDKLISSLKIVIEDAGKGIWRFRDDDPNLKRESEEQERW